MTARTLIDLYAMTDDSIIDEQNSTIDKSNISSINIPTDDSYQLPIHRQANIIFTQTRDRCLRPIIASDVHPQSAIELFNNLTVNPPEATIPEGLSYMMFGRTPAENTYLQPIISPLPGTHIPLLFISGFNTYDLADRLTDFYQEYIRLQAYNLNRQRGENVSPDRVWSSNRYKKILMKWLTMAIELYRVDYPHGRLDMDDLPMKRAVMEAMYNHKIHVSQYRITWVMSIINYFRQFTKIETMLDPFSGWGDRLIGAIKMGVSYEGYDPNIKLQPGYKAMIEQLVPLVNGDQSQYSITPVGFEDAIFRRVSYDLILTSPPYGPVEIYDEGNPNQSIEKYKKVDDWFNYFYFPALDKAWRGLRSGGLLILQIGDTRTFKMVEKTIIHFRGITDCVEWGQFLTLAQLGKYPNLHLVYQRR